MRPKDCRYTETHEWVRVEGEVATVGITDFAVEQLSDVVHLELPEIGDQVRQDSPFGEVESVKAVSDLIAPVSGEVLEVHRELLEDLDVLSKDPFRDGWLIKVRVKDPSELTPLLDAGQYGRLIEAGQKH